MSLILIRHAIVQAILRGSWQKAAFVMPYIQILVLWFGFLGLPWLRALYMVWIQLFNPAQYDVLICLLQLKSLAVCWSLLALFEPLISIRLTLQIILPSDWNFIGNRFRSIQKIHHRESISSRCAHTSHLRSNDVRVGTSFFAGSNIIAIG